MEKMLCDFWSWLGMTPEKYAIYGLKFSNDHMEYDYPKFSELKKAAMSIIDSGVLNVNELQNLITVMALDNEDEEILCYIEENSSKEQMMKIVDVGLSHLQPEARWQIAELISRRRPLNFVDKLRVLCNDKHSYVRKRAKNCFELLNL